MPAFLLLSSHGDSLFLADRLRREGHRVAMHTRDRRAAQVGVGIVDRREHPVPVSQETVLFDDVGQGITATNFRRRGLAVVGGNLLDQELELDRRRGRLLMAAHGIRTPETRAFSSLTDAKAFLTTHDGVWYFKPSGNAAVSLTHHGESAPLRRWLAWASGQIAADQFILQKAVQGTEVSVEGWFDGERWVPPFNSTIEDKHFLVGDLGPRTGCQSNVVWGWKDERPWLAVETLLKMTPLLKARRYVGPLDLNCIVDEHGVPHGLEWSARFGFDALQALSCLIQGDLGTQLFKFARGELDRFDVRMDAKALTLRVSVPPYPTDTPAAARGLAGLPLDPLLERPTTRFLPDDVMLGPNGPACAGRDGSLGVVYAVGPHFNSLRSDVLEQAGRLDIPEKQYRTDPVQRAETVWQALAAHGARGLAGFPASTAGRDEGANPAPDRPGPPPFVGEVTDASY